MKKKQEMIDDERVALIKKVCELDDVSVKMVLSFVLGIKVSKTTLDVSEQAGTQWTNV